MEELKSKSIKELIDEVKAQVVWLEQGYSDATSEFDGLAKIANALDALQERVKKLGTERDEYKRATLDKIGEIIALKTKLRKINDLSSGIN